MDTASSFGSSAVATFDETRLQKRERLRRRGVNPYPYSFPANEPIGELVRRALEAEQEADSGPPEISATINGRVWSRRKMGRSVFLDLKDDSGKIQIYLRQKDLAESDRLLLDDLDLGDILSVSGPVFRTRSEELSVRAREIELLAKAVVPLPIGKEFAGETRHRATDPELKYRHRYQHWLLDDTDRERMRLRTRIISSIRHRMEADGFLDVITPTIEPIYGGAEARPFATRVWALGNQTAYLRISPELYLKRYLVAGFPKVFTICQNYRNEGIDHTHNPEFSMMEWYETGTDYRRQMERFENLVAETCREIHGKSTISFQGQEVDFAPPWTKLTVMEAIREHLGLDVSEMNADEVNRELVRRELAAAGSTLSWGEAVATLFEHGCEQHLREPTFILDHPVEISPLTKRHREDPRLVERFEPYVCGMEIGNAYSELTDPVEQWERLREQRHADDFENHPVDADFVRAIGMGMPPTGGVGLGIDRLIMLLTDAPSIRDIIPFPMLRGG